MLRGECILALLHGHRARSLPVSLNVILSGQRGLDQCLIAVSKHHDHGNCYKVKHLIGTSLQFLRFSYHHGRTHDDTQADMVLEKELRVL